MLTARNFRQRKGREGQAPGRHVRTHLALGGQALRYRRPRVAVRHFRNSLSAPEDLGQARHLLANQSDDH